MGILKAVIDAIMGATDLAGGRSVTKLTAALSDVGTTATVESTLRFGEWNDGAADGAVLINGETVAFSGRTSSSPYTFTGLTRGVNGTTAKDHPIGSLVVDVSDNRTALDLVRRGFFVDKALAPDLDVIARNLGLRKCPNIDVETWRRIIKAVAYLPKSTVDAFDKALLAITNDATSYSVIERLISNPYEVFVEITIPLVSADPLGVRGRMILRGNTLAVTDGLTQVTVPEAIQSVNGVYLDTLGARRGLRDGLTNFFTAGSFTPGASVITLGSSPGGIGTAVIVDLTAIASGGVSPPNNYHYLGTGFGSDQVDLSLRYDEVTVPADSTAPANHVDHPALGAMGTSVQTIRLDDGDRWAYLSDPALAIRCLLDDIRQAGTKVTVSTKL